jgi:hypothetical protein
VHQVFFNSFAPIRLFSRVRLSQWLHRDATGSAIADESWQANIKSSVFTCSPVLHPGRAPSLFNSFAPIRIRLFSRVRLRQWLHRNATGSGIAGESWQANIKSSVLTCSPVLQPGRAPSLFQFVCPYSSVFTCSPEPVASSQCNGQRDRRRMMAGEYEKLCFSRVRLWCNRYVQQVFFNSFAPIRLFSRVRLSQWLHRNATGSGIAGESWQANIKSSVLTCWPVLQPVCPASLFQFVCPHSSVFTVFA